MKKIAILISSLAMGGAERVVSTLLTEFEKIEIDVTLVLMDSTIKYDLPMNQKILYLKHNDLKQYPIQKFFSLIFWGFKYKKLCEKYEIDISLSFMNRANYINILSRFFGSKSKIVISERIVSSNEYNSTSIKDVLSKILVKNLYPKADLILPNSYGIKLDLINNFHLDENIVSVVNNPINIEKIIELANENTHVEIDKNKFVFMTIGRLHHQKNHKILLSAIKDLNAVLYIIGDGYLKKDLLAQIEDLNIHDKVVLLGNKHNPFKYLKFADCFLFSSNYEGFPNVLLEALALKLPIISTDCNSGPREILAPELSADMIINDIEFVQYGILVKVNDVNSMKKAMQIVMEDTLLRKQYQDKAFERALTYKTSNIIQEYLTKLNFNSEGL